MDFGCRRSFNPDKRATGIATLMIIHELGELTEHGFNPDKRATGIATSFTRKVNGKRQLSFNPDKRATGIATCRGNPFAQIAQLFQSRQAGDRDCDAPAEPSVFVATFGFNPDKRATGIATYWHFSYLRCHLACFNPDKRATGIATCRFCPPGWV